MQINQPSASEQYFEQSQQNIDLQDSAIMNQDEQALFLDIKKSRSNDSFLGKLIGTTLQMQKRPLVINMNEFCPPKQKNDNPTTPAINYTSIFKKVNKQKKHNKCDYQKNICGYITKKIIREFIGITFQNLIEDLCKKYSCSSQQARKFYLSKIQYVTGPSHIPALLNPEKQQSQQIIGFKLAFREFFYWFLKQRYLRYLLLQGKMTNKKAYIEYKNNILFGYINEDQLEINILIKRFMKQKNEEKQMQEQMDKLKALASNGKKYRISRDKNIIITKTQ